MAEVYKSVGGRKLSKALAVNEGVQAELEARTFEMAARAEAELQQHRASGDAMIDVEHGRVDWYVVLSDERGQKAALSIEFGRAESVDRKTGRRIAAMDGLYVLHRATHLPVKRRGGVRF
jgi:hypothetical protein